LQGFLEQETRRQGFREVCTKDTTREIRTAQRQEFARLFNELDVKLRPALLACLRRLTREEMA
jgi:hypothetical protein